MAPPRRGNGDLVGGKRDSAGMAPQRRDGPGSASRAQNGVRPGFRTDTAISNRANGADRTLQRWVSDGPADMDGSLESSSNTGRWDQFAENERRFGITTDYDEHYYTTAIDRSHPQYAERLAAAERAAREIEKSTPTTAHVAEERVMDFAGGNGQGGDEEDKYSGVKRQQDFPPLSAARDNKYTPPARRTPATGGLAAASTLPDLSSNSNSNATHAKAAPKKQPTPVPRAEEKTPVPASNAVRPAPPVATPVATPVAIPLVKTPEPKAAEKPADTKQLDGKTTKSATKDTPEPPKATMITKSTSKPGTPAVSGTGSLRASASSARASLSPSAHAAAPLASSSAANSPAPPSATENVENALLKDFKDFASQQRLHAEKARHNKMKADAQSKLQELKKFANSFKLSTPVPSDLISIIAKDPAKQRQIQEQALQNAEEIARAKVDGSKSKSSGSSTVSVKTPTSSTPASSTPAPRTSGAPTPSPAPPASAGPATTTAADTTRTPTNHVRPQAPVHSAHNASPSGMPNRHPNARGGYMQQGFRQQSQPYRGDRSGPQHATQGHGTGHLAERIRNSDQNRYNKNSSNNHGSSHFAVSGDARVPPTGPAGSIDPSFSRRLSANPAGGHMSQKLNPTTHEFRPSPFAAAFNPTGPSAGSSPRSAANPLPTDHHAALSTASVAGTALPSPRVAISVLIRRKTQNVSAEKCDILSQIKTIKPPAQGRNWDENGGLRPSFDTPLLWRQVQDDERPDSTMRLNYTQLFERMAYAAASMATPLQGQAIPPGMQHLPHQQQLPLHLQHGAHLGLRPPHNMPPLPMHPGGSGPHGHAPQAPFNGGDDHRMMASNSAQSYASPRMAQVAMYPQHGGATPQMAYNQPVMPFMQNGPQMGQFRGYANGPQAFMPPQSGPMMHMVPPQFVAVPGGMMAGQQQMAVYPGAPQFMGPPGATGAGAGGAPPPQQMNGTNGFPSPNRPAAAPMMGHQGSQQGQPMYGMSPSMQYQQPAFGPQHPGQGAMRGGYSNHGAQQFGTSPQNVHQYGPQHRNGSGNYSGKNYQNHNHSHSAHHGPPAHQSGHARPPSAHQGRQAGGDSAEEAK